MRRIRNGEPCPPTKCFLRVAMPAVTAYALAILLSYLQARAENFLLARVTYMPFLEYIVASCVIVICGAVLIEIVWRDGTRE